MLCSLSGLCCTKLFLLWPQDCSGNKLLGSQWLIVDSEGQARPSIIGACWSHSRASADACEVTNSRKTERQHLLNSKRHNSGQKEAQVRRHVRDVGSLTLVANGSKDRFCTGALSLVAPVGGAVTTKAELRWFLKTFFPISGISSRLSITVKPLTQVLPLL